MKRWYIVERCDSMRGWERVPKSEAYESLREAELAMKTFDQRYAMRARRASKSFTP